MTSQSNQSKSLKISSRAEFIKYIDSFAKISDSFIAEVKEGGMSIITASPDNTLISYGSYSCSSNYSTNLNIPDCKKLVRVLDTISSDTLELKLNSNNIEYVGDNVRFKYHLFEDGFLQKPSLSLDKIKSFAFDITFNLTKQQLSAIVKGSTFATETNKLYIYTDENKLIAELTDKARHNSDSYVMSLGVVDFKLQPVAINFDNVRLLTLLDDIVVVNINTKYGVVIIETSNKTSKISYLISSLTQ
jgi:hypothetical protein